MESELGESCFLVSIIKHISSKYSEYQTFLLLTDTTYLSSTRFAKHFKY